MMNYFTWQPKYQSGQKHRIPLYSLKLLKYNFGRFAAVIIFRHKLFIVNIPVIHKISNTFLTKQNSFNGKS